MSIVQTFPASGRSPNVVMAFTIPDDMTPPLRQITKIWERLRLLRTDMPLVEDFDLTLLSDHEGHILVVDVADQPSSFRIETAGWWVVEFYGEPLAGHEIKKAEDRPPLEDLWIQCMAAITDRRPVFYRHNTDAMAYDRAVYPLWGDGAVEKLVVAITQLPSAPDGASETA